jgi:hypothetical protein
VNAVYWAYVDAGSVLCPDARFADDIGHAVLQVPRWDVAPQSKRASITRSARCDRRRAGTHRPAWASLPETGQGAASVTCVRMRSRIMTPHAPGTTRHISSGWSAVKRSVRYTIH